MKRKHVEMSDLGESQFEFYARTKDHHRCLFEYRGERCEGAAAMITKTLASKSGGGERGHQCVIRGGYCGKHWREINGYSG